MEMHNVTEGDDSTDVPKFAEQDETTLLIFKQLHPPKKKKKWYSQVCQSKMTRMAS